MNSYAIKIIISNFYKFLFPIKGSNNRIINKGKCYNLKFEIVGNNNQITIENSFIINCKIYIRGSNNLVYIGKNCHINNTFFRFEDDNGIIKIGKETSIEGASLEILEKDKSIIIGNDCMFSSDININISDSHSILSVETGERINYGKNIIIGNHVWLGRDVTILKGIEIKNNSIVGTKSLVTKNVEENAIYVGIPARKVKDNVDWKKQRI